MDPNNNPYQPQQNPDDQQDGSQPTADNTPPVNNDQPVVDRSGVTDGGQYDNVELPPPDEIEADEHYLALQNQPVTNNLQPDQPEAPQQQTDAQPPVDSTSLDMPTVNNAASVVDNQPQPQENQIPQTSVPPSPTSPDNQSLPQAQPDVSEIQPQQPPVSNQPPVQDTGGDSQPQEGHDSQAQAATSQEQQTPWWELPPPESAAADATADDTAALPPNRSDAEYQMPAIQTFKRNYQQGNQPEEAIQTEQAEPQASLEQPAPTPEITADIQQPDSQTEPQPVQDIGHGSADLNTAPQQVGDTNQLYEQPASTTGQTDTPAPIQPEAESAPPTAQTPAPHPEQQPVAPEQPVDRTAFQLPTQNQPQPPQAPPAAQESPPAGQNGNAAPAPPAADQPQATQTNLKSKLTDLFNKLKKFNYKPMVTAAIIGIAIFGVFNSQVIIGQVQYLTTPAGGLNTNSGAVDANAPIGDEAKIIIPRLNVDVPVVYDEPSFEEEKVQKALERGVVHYGTTAMPGEKGNSVIVGHSSNNWWDSGKYKFAFILLDKMENGDEIVLHYEGTRYVYEVHKKFIVEPTDTSVLKQTEDPILTLITCTPPGTSWQRLIVQARQVSPDPDQNAERSTAPPPGEAGALPSDSYGGGFVQFLRTLF